ncbi:MAG TPA: GAF domain-containing protein, partial [Chitinophagaceae bacterium]|nr:GAF domain-containing protein [Chitinophagaceae bacterium]
MQENISTENGFNSLLSIKPLVAVLNKMIAEGKPGARKLYQNLLHEIESKPKLLEPIKDAAVLKEESELVETLLSTIFPPSTSANQGMYAISFPFRSEIIYASPSFKELFIKDETNFITVPDNKTNYTITIATLNLAYNLILRKFYNWDLPAVASSVHNFVDAETGLTKYLELKLNAQFVDVSLTNTSFTLPSSFKHQRSLEIDELKKQFPIENFQFEGLVVIDVTDITTDQVIAEIKNTLININAFSDVMLYDELQVHVQTFLGIKDVKIGISPFFKVNDYYLFSDLHFKNSILFQNKKVSQNKRQVTELCQHAFRHNDHPLLFHNLTAHSHSDNELLHYYFLEGARSLIICPLKRDGGELIGLLEIVSEEAGRFKYQHLSQIKSAMQLFTLALEKSIEALDSQVDKTIKEHFTAIQPAVEWKFTEAAFEFLEHRQENEMATIPSITFNEVYPLFAAIDVRNSSVERNNAIQLDLLEQLNSARIVLEKASSKIEFPLLKEIEYKVDKYITAAAETLLSDDEMMIYEFLQNDMDALFRHLHTTRPELKKLINDYFGRLDPQKKIIYHHRKLYEDTITKINDTLDRFIDKEQATMQHIYPHYFERYVTDGIEFNIYIGQSLAPQHAFDQIYINNLKMWQLTLLVKAARLTHSLENKLPLPLQTTQLILAHCIPLSISFRRKERKFDVDGAYNIRYELVKKRIDKVHVRDTGERLTQPGKIAIVYSQQKELNEYMEYVEFLQNENMIVDEVEHLDLEELQGISGLKAIRLQVNLNASHDHKTEAKVELSK